MLFQFYLFLQYGVQQSGCKSCACNSDFTSRWAYVNCGTDNVENGRVSLKECFAHLSIYYFVFSSHYLERVLFVITHTIIFDISLH